MKGFERFILIIFSLIILGLALTSIFGALEFLDLSKITNYYVKYMLDNVIMVVLIGSVLSLLAIFGIFINNDDKEDIKSGLAIKHETGTVFITKETFESIVYNVTRKYDCFKNVKVGICISEEGIVANVYSYITPETIVPDITLKLQKDIKETVLKQTTVEVMEANVKIKGVVTLIKKEG
jgi:uncharacterized alkaline shock family protein YloU